MANIQVIVHVFYLDMGFNLYSIYPQMSDSALGISTNDFSVISLKQLCEQGTIITGSTVGFDFQVDAKTWKLCFSGNMLCEPPVKWGYGLQQGFSF